MNKERTFLQHIFDQTEIITDIVGTLSWDEFSSSALYQYAVMRALEIIGEAAKHISEETRVQYPHIAFREMAGLRDRLIHGYFSVDNLRVWEIVQHDIPELAEQLRVILPDFDNE